MAYGGSCCRCLRKIGDDVKVQPTICDGEVYCPRCFVVRRMAEEPARFNASQACAATCGICGWESVSFGALPGQRLRCGSCLRMTAHKVNIDKLPFTTHESRTIEALAREAGMTDPKKLPRSRART